MCGSSFWTVLTVFVILTIITLIEGSSNTGHSSNSLNCKKKVYTLQLEYCSGFRSRRSIVVDNPTNDHQSMTEDVRRKRQIMSIREIILSSRVPMHDTQYPSVPNVARHEIVPIVPPSDYTGYRTSRRFETLPKENGSDPGFEISNDELVEIFTEIYGRMPRSSDMKDNEKVDSIQQCCTYTELCHQINFDCPG